jgi:hypothetical protein
MKGDEMAKAWVEKSQNGRINFTEVGQELVGRLKSIDEVDLFDRKVKQATILTCEGPKNILLTTLLQNLLDGVSLNTEIKIRYEGEGKTKKGRKVKLFNLWVLEDTTTSEEARALVGNPDEF